MAAEDRKVEMQNTDVRRILERFVVENDDLLTLEARIGRFNIFDALRITDVEIRHSNFLAFLLDPVESHGQGQLFLKAVLMDLLKNAPEFPISPIALDGTDLRGVEVRREWNNIDLLITSKEPKFAVVIENKVRSREHSNQLSRYQQTMTEHYSDRPTLFIYLTPDGDEPSEDTWLPYCYADIFHVLNRVRTTHKNAIGDEVLVFIDHYLNLLGTRFMNDAELDGLCRQIYKNHRQALELIIERGRPDSPAIGEVLEVLKNDSRWHVLYHSNKYVDCVLDSWRAWLPPIGPDDDYPVGACFWVLEGKLVCSPMFLGPTIDAASRREMLTKLREEGSAIGLKRSKSGDGGKYVRVFIVETVLEWGEEDEPEPTAIRESLKRKLDALYPKHEKLAPILKSFCKPS